MRLIAVWFFLVAFFGCSGANAKDEVGDDIVSGVVCNVVKHASGAVAQAIATLVLKELSRIKSAELSSSSLLSKG